ncbi:hypothetical protein EI94DRAFT_1738123 [Lactarius quietus]|nr:hypothetical protein EI94DRAFT_1738123 [Lactarius quietus]
MDASVNLTDEDSDSKLEEDLLVCSAVAIGCAMLLYGSQFVKIPQHTPVLTGQLWLDELLCGHDGRFYNEIGMQKIVFLRLVTLQTSHARTNLVTCHLAKLQEGSL